MKKILFAYIIVFAFKANAQTWEWGVGARDTFASGNEGYAITIDTLGNSYSTGAFNSGAISFGSTTLINTGGHYDVFLAKYDSNGNPIWAVKPNGTETADNWTQSVSSDKNANIFLTGFFGSSNLIFGTYTLTNVGVNNIFLVKYDKNGNVLWAKSAGGSSSDLGYSVSADINGNAIVTGNFSSPTIVFGSYTLTNTSHNSTYSNNYFIAKYDANGNVLWAKNDIDTNGNGLSSSISTDINGNSYVTGSLYNTIIIDTYTLTSSVPSNGNSVFLAKYDPNGNVLWAKTSTGSGGGGPNFVTTDASGNVFVTGYFLPPNIMFGTTMLTPDSIGAGLSSAIFITKYDANGNVLWVKGAGGTYHDVGYSVSTYTGGVIVSGGFTSPHITFGTYTLTPPPNATDPFFIVQYDLNGEVICASALTSGGDDQNGVSVDKYGYAYICGDYQVNPLFVVGSDTLPLTAEEQVFVAKWLGNCNRAGIEEYANGNARVNVYPNPNTGSFVIEPQNTLYNVRCTLYDVNGKAVLSQTINGKTSIDASSLNEGVYNISLQSNEGVVNKRLVIVR